MVDAADRDPHRRRRWRAAPAGRGRRGAHQGRASTIASTTGIPEATARTWTGEWLRSGDLGDARRRRLPLHQGPPEGHRDPRRQQHRGHRGRERALRTRRRAGGRGRRRPPRRARRGRRRVRRGPRRATTLTRRRADRRSAPSGSPTTRCRATSGSSTRCPRNADRQGRQGPVAHPARGRARANESHERGAAPRRAARRSQRLRDGRRPAGPLPRVGSPRPATGAVPARRRPDGVHVRRARLGARRSWRTCWLPTCRRHGDSDAAS